jgi:hypothetical protein
MTFRLGPLWVKRSLSRLRENVPRAIMVAFESGRDDRAAGLSEIGFPSLVFGRLPRSRIDACRRNSDAVAASQEDHAGRR